MDKDLRRKEWLKSLDKGVNAMGLFDGMSVGRLALNDLGIPVSNYFASELDKYAINISQKNFPDTKQLGCVTKVLEKDLPKIDLLMGGSPCQGFSFSGKMLNFNDPRSKLFFDYVKIKNELKPTYFLLENVVMKQWCQDIISEQLGCEPIMINSNTVSGQQRRRLYWTNIPDVTQPDDRGITWGDVREHNVSEKSMYYTIKANQWLARHSLSKKNKLLRIHQDDEKMQMIEASHHKKYSSQRFFGVIDLPPKDILKEMLDTNNHDLFLHLNSGLAGMLGEPGSVDWMYNPANQQVFVAKHGSGDYQPLTKEGVVPHKDFMLRYVTPLECERLQTLPDNYTAGVSNTQRYKMIGNGWTKYVIEHILGGLK